MRIDGDGVHGVVVVVGVTWWRWEGVKCKISSLGERGVNGDDTLYLWCILKGNANCYRKEPSECPHLNRVPLNRKVRAGGGKRDTETVLFINGFIIRIRLMEGLSMSIKRDK